MRSYSWILITVLLFGFTAFSQQKTTEHIVSKGETISKIAKQYNLKASDIYELNPEAKNGIKFKSVLLIPIASQNDISSSKASLTPEIIHEVLAKETLYGISKEYSVAVDDLYKANPTLEESGLKVGQKLIIIGGTLRKKKVSPKELTAATEDLQTSIKYTEGIEYEVLPKETKYNIAKEHGITVAMLDMANPILQTEELKVGQKIIIPVKKYVPDVVSESKEVVLPKKEDEVSGKLILKDVMVSSPSNITVEAVKETVGFEYEVLPKQTKYSIAKEYGITVADLDNANPKLEGKALKVGQMIMIPAKVKQAVVASESKESTQEKKEVAPKVEEKTKATVENVLPTVEVVKKESTTDSGIIHEVLQKETKYGIAKEYGITVADLDKANPNLESEGLKIGQKINIPAKETNGVSSEKEIQSGKETAVANTQISNTEKTTVVKPVIENKIEEVTVTHKVLAKETKYGIAKHYGITVKELERQNPKIATKFNIGSLLTIRSPKITNPTVVKQEFVGEPMEEESNINSYHGPEFIDQLILTASENIGVRYRIGGTSKDGFDCSGLMCTAFGAHDIQLPRTSLEQSRYGEVVELDNAQKGDLIFFKTRGGRQINHVGMVVEVADGDVKFIHASNSGVIISSIKESYYSKRVVQVNRVL
ncbi:LysM peptidoglycan-binding domain-containing protein [Flavobacterium sp. NG2]|uniref:LysM peptidoglycan-binding domain-containing protein n=1 Tax=Flavobacterium sp. NG2 TaxID=3097547 RepID=UPI002A7F333F|nr:LysM peptidoglycan-binding domain-containing protein [Flavobacterium sp. NG2]WPR71564.1 LysM peptidoglycan-binding domain-containing protein [Flavobacterium sp. NG2]